jgi:positive regulator of sigma E activity
MVPFAPNFEVLRVAIDLSGAERSALGRPTASAMRLRVKHLIALEFWVTLTVTGSLLLSWDAVAYVGPGIGMSVIGVLVSFTVAVILTAVGFFWYPLRRFLRKRRAKQADRESIEVSKNMNTDEE